MGNITRNKGYYDMTDAQAAQLVAFGLYLGVDFKNPRSISPSHREALEEKFKELVDAPASE